MSIEPLVKSLAEAPADGWNDDLHGQVTWRTLFSAGLSPTEALTLGYAELTEGQELKHHRHLPPEIYYLLSGQAQVHLEGQDHLVLANTAVFIPGNALHGIKNVGHDIVRFIYAFAVDSFDEVVYDFGIPPLEDPSLKRPRV